MTPVLDHGSEALKQKYVPRVVSGGVPGVVLPLGGRRGSDVAGMRTRAVRDGDHYLLNGRKLWITNAGVSDFYTVFAKTDPDAGHRGISCFVVEKSFPGFSISKLEHKLGVRGSPTGESRSTTARSRREPHRRRRPRLPLTRWGRSIARVRSSVRRRSGSPAARSARNSYVQDRRQFGPRLADFQGLQFMLADMATQVDAARCSSTALFAARRGPARNRSASSTAKLFAPTPRCG